MGCNRYKTNAPIVCNDAMKALACAKRRNLQLTFAEMEDSSAESKETFVNTIVGASKTGQWCVVDGTHDTATSDALREAVYRVWLKGSWDHHENFRLWLVVNEEHISAPPAPAAPLGDDLDESMGTPVAVGRGASPTAATSSYVSEKLPFLISASAITLRYTDDFEHEFLAREIISAVADSHFYGVEDTREHVQYLAPTDVVRLFDSARAEDVFSAIIVNNTESNLKWIAQARDDRGRSPLDIAIKKDFQNASVLLRDIGCQSEVFDFGMMLKPSFHNMLVALLDPAKPFPFDPKVAASKVAFSGDGNVLKSLFNCRVDVNFTSEDYPLVEAAATGNMDVVYIVLDRMGATGVHPLRDSFIARHFLVKLLTWRAPKDGKIRAPSEAGDEPAAPPPLDRRASIASAGGSSIATGGRRRSSTNMKEFLNHTQITVANWLADTCVEDEVRFPIPLTGVSRVELYPELLQKVLRCIDVESAKDTEMLLEFFIHFDPENDLARRVVIRAVNDLAKYTPETPDDEPVETVVFALLAQMIRKGPVASPMLRWGVERALQLTLIPLTYRVDDTTLLMIALNDPPNVAGARVLLESSPLQTKMNFANQVDRYGNNVLKKLVLDITKDVESHEEHLIEYADAVEALLQHSVDHVVKLPAFSASLFTLCARQDLGEMCFELLNSRPQQGGSVVLACNPNTISLMWRRLRRKEAKQDSGKRRLNFIKREKREPIVGNFAASGREERRRKREEHEGAAKGLLQRKDSVQQDPEEEAPAVVPQEKKRQIMVMRWETSIDKAAEVYTALLTPAATEDEEPTEIARTTVAVRAGDPIDGVSTFPFHSDAAMFSKEEHANLLFEVWEHATDGGRPIGSASIDVRRTLADTEVSVGIIPFGAELQQQPGEAPPPHIGSLFVRISTPKTEKQFKREAHEGAAKGVLSRNDEHTPSDDQKPEEETEEEKRRAEKQAKRDAHEGAAKNLLQRQEEVPAEETDEEKRRAERQAKREAHEGAAKNILQRQEQELTEAPPQQDEPTTDTKTEEEDSVLAAEAAKFKVDIPDPVPPVVVIDERVNAARIPNPEKASGYGLFVRLELPVLAHIASFVDGPRDVCALSASCASWFHACQFDEVWQHRTAIVKETNEKMTSGPMGTALGFGGGSHVSGDATPMDPEAQSVADGHGTPPPPGGLGHFPTTDNVRSARSYYVEAVMVYRKLKNENLI